MMARLFAIAYVVCHVTWYCNLNGLPRSLADCTTQSIAFYQTLSREGGIWVARLVLVLIGATRQHFKLDTNTTYMHKVNISLTHRFSFMWPPAAVGFWQIRLIFIWTCTDWCYKTTFCTRYYPTQLKPHVQSKHITYIFHVAHGWWSLLANKANLYLYVTDYDIHTILGG